MNKNVSLLGLACALGAAGGLQGNVAQAADITGKIGIGTWNTQAEFADVKVVKGTTTLYQSNFTLNQTGWTTSGGTWGRQSGYFRQTGGGAPAMAWVGNTTWNNYTLTLRARKISGSEGFLITFGAPGDVTNTFWNIGGWGNTKHVIQVPGVVAPEVGGTIQNNVWYDIKVQLTNNNIKCYLNGALIQDTTRILDASERTGRIQQILNSPGYQLLTPIEKTTLQELFNRNVYLGQAARDTFRDMPSAASFSALTAQQQLGIIRKVGAKRLTWSRGYGYGGDAYRDDTITSSVDSAVMLYNSLGVFDKHVTANNDPGVPTADANYDGWMRFGNSINYRVALHELGHCMGVGTGPGWGNRMVNGSWNGAYANAQLSVFEGSGSVMHGDGMHMWPYGLNYDNESSPVNDQRHVLVIAAMRRDMGIASTLWMPSTTSVASGTYRLVPRNASFAALDVAGANPNNSSAININNYTGAASQKFLVDVQTDGTYRIRTTLTGNRCIELPGGVTTNGTKIKLWDDNGNAAQRWYVIPMGDGWFKIAPKNDMGKGMDLDGGAGATANGTLVQSWDYLDGTNQQWKFAPATAPSYSTTIANGTYRITPRHATGSALDVLNSNSANNGQIDISTYTGATNQKFLLDLQGDGSYSIRTSLTDNRFVDLPFGDTANGNKLVIYDNTGSNNQRWYFVPTDSGWYKIVPKVDMDTKCMDVAGGVGATADGTLVHNWDYLGSTNQQWQLTPVTSGSPLMATQPAGASRTTTTAKKAPIKTTAKNPSAGGS